MGRQEFSVARIEDRHDRLFPGDRTDREPATDDLGDRRQIGFDIHQALRAGVAEAEADRFVEDQQHAGVALHLPQHIEIVL